MPAVETRLRGPLNCYALAGVDCSRRGPGDHHAATRPHGAPGHKPGSVGLLEPFNAHMTESLSTSTSRSPSVGQPAAGTVRTPLHPALPVPIPTIVTTFNNGSLGSGIDEERSEMR